MTKQNDIKAFEEKVENAKIKLNSIYGKNAGIVVVVEEEKSNAQTLYDMVYNSAIDEVLEKLKREVNQHHKYGIEGFKIGICHSRMLIEGMKKE